MTDSPLYLSYYYSNNSHILGLIQQELKRADHLHVFLNRKKAYNPKGRYPTEAEAREIDAAVRRMLDEEAIPYYLVDADQEAADRIATLIDTAPPKPSE